MALVQILVFFAGLGGAALFIFTFGLRRNKEGEIVGVSTTPVVVAVLLFVGALFLNSAFGEIGAGERGVVKRFGAVTGQVLNPGFYAIFPVFNTVERCNVQVQKSSEDAAAVSSNLQDVKATVVVNYHQRPEACTEIIRVLGNDLNARIVLPSVQESIKAATAQYTAEELIQKRPLVRNDMEKLLLARVQQYAVVDALAITNFDFSAAYNKAIEQKALVDQQVQQARLELERVSIEAQQQVKKAQAERDARIAQATGEAQAIRLQGEAQATALAAQKAQISVELVQLRRVEALRAWVEKWNGSAMPSIVTGGSGGNLQMFNIPSSLLESTPGK